MSTLPYLRLTGWWWLARGEREGRECLDFVTGFSERCILHQARVHHSHTPPPPRFQIRLFSSAVADTEQNPETGYQLHVTLARGPGNAVLSPKSTVCYWELESCVCRVNLIFQRELEKKNRVRLMALTLCQFWGRKNRKLENPKSLKVASTTTSIESE